MQVDAGGGAVAHQLVLRFLEAGRLPGLDGALGQRLAAVRDHQVEVEPDDAAEAAAGVAGADRRVEGEQAGAGGLVVDLAAGAGEAVAEVPGGLFVAVVIEHVHGQLAVAAVEGGLEAGGHAVGGDAAGPETVGDDGEAQWRRGGRGLLLAGGSGEGGGLVRTGMGCRSRRCRGASGSVGVGAAGQRLAARAGDRSGGGLAAGLPAFGGGDRHRQLLAPVDAGVALGQQLVDDLLLVEAGRHLHREADDQARVVEAGGTCADGGADAGHVVDAHRLGALPAVQGGGVRHQQLEVVVQFGHRADRGARGAHRIGLVDGDGRWHAFDAVDLRPVHPVEELAGIGREGLDVAALPFGIEGVEDQRGLAAARDAGDDDQLSGGDVEVEVLEVVLAGTTDADRHLWGGGLGSGHGRGGWVAAGGAPNWPSRRVRGCIPGIVRSIRCGCGEDGGSLHPDPGASGGRVPADPAMVVQIPCQPSCRTVSWAWQGRGSHGLMASIRRALGHVARLPARDDGFRLPDAVPVRRATVRPARHQSTSRRSGASAPPGPGRA